MARFDYREAGTVGEAVALLAQWPETSRLLAGGTDLVPRIRRGDIKPELLIGITTIPGLTSITQNADGSLSIGALTTLHSITSDPIVRTSMAALPEAALLIGSRQIRNVATMGGNICNASPAADTAPPLLALGATARLVGAGREREIEIDHLFTAPGQTVLAQDEMLVSFSLPAQAKQTGSAYIKLSPRRAMDIAVVGVASWVSVDPATGKCNDARIALGAVAATPIRAREAESILIGRQLTEELARKAAGIAASEASPISDLRASQGYRRDMVEVLVRRAIMLAGDRSIRGAVPSEVTP